MSQIKQGYLEKQGQVVKSWKRRWFVLDSHVLSYYEKPDDDKPKGSMSIYKAQLKLMPDTVREHCAEIHTANRVLRISGADSGDITQWMRAIKDAAENFDGIQAPPKWKQSSECANCNASFTFTNRRHHCRNCGASYCGECCNKALPLPQFGMQSPVRVCKSCFDAHRRRSLTNLNQVATVAASSAENLAYSDEDSDHDVPIANKDAADNKLNDATATAATAQIDQKAHTDEHAQDGRDAQANAQAKADAPADADAEAQAQADADAEAEALETERQREEEEARAAEEEARAAEEEARAAEEEARAAEEEAQRRAEEEAEEMRVRMEEAQLQAAAEAAMEAQRKAEEAAVAAAMEATEKAKAKAEAEAEAERNKLRSSEADDTSNNETQLKITVVLGQTGQGLVGCDLGTPARGGAVVNRLVPGGAAEVAGIQLGDIITAMDDEKLQNQKSAVAFVKNAAAGQKVVFSVTRGVKWDGPKEKPEAKENVSAAAPAAADWSESATDAFEAVALKADMDLLKRGVSVLKLASSSSGAKKTTLMLVETKDGWAVGWSSKKKDEDAQIPLKGARLIKGQTTEVFQRKANSSQFGDKSSLSFSIVGASRTLDIVCSSTDDFKCCTNAFAKLIDKA